MSTRAGAARTVRMPGRAYPGDSHRSGDSHPLRGPGAAPSTQRPPRPRVIHSRTKRTLRERLHLQGVRLAWVLVPLIALLLGGVVFVNVQRLNLTTQTGRTVDMYNQAQSDILRLRAVLAEKDGQVVDQASKRLGMVLAPGSGLTYVSVPKEARIAPGQAPRTR
jgi:hypothetical protein